MCIFSGRIVQRRKLKESPDEVPCGRHGVPEEYHDRLHVLRGLQRRRAALWVPVGGFWTKDARVR